MYMARKPFRYGEKIYMAGESVPVKADDVSMLQGQGKIGGAVREIETASIKPPENAVMPKAKPKHLGGGYYLLPSGAKIRGKENAINALKGDADAK